jgi:hypothetical protein
MQTDGQTEMAKLKGIFLPFIVGNKPKQRALQKYTKVRTRQLSRDVI